MTETAPGTGDFVHYDANPTYPLVTGRLANTWRAAVATLPLGSFVLAIDGASSLDWLDLSEAITKELDARDTTARVLFVHQYFKDWEEIARLTASPELGDDPDFATLPSIVLADLLQVHEIVHEPNQTTVVFGPGAALFPHDVRWYVDVPKRVAEASIVEGRSQNLGQPVEQGPATTKRMHFIDWPLLDRHRDELSRGVDRWIELSDPEHPISLDGASLLTNLEDLATRPFRVRPTFNTAPWGGHWGQEKLGQERFATNTAVGFQLLAPESGVVLSDGDKVLELPLSLLVAMHPEQILGAAVTPSFGTSFPIRFNYLDTVNGDHLSVHCHPQLDYMRSKFGWPYTQHESYYVVEGGEGSQIFLGLRGDVDVADFEAAAHAADDHGVAFDVERFVQFFPSTRGQLFMIPGGTPHGSSKGNVVLEVSATPYLYSLRFYDWLRRDAKGQPRPVHVDHAFQNLDVSRSGDAVRGDLVQAPRPLRGTASAREELLGSLDECFFEVRRLILSPHGTWHDDASDRFHVLNVVDGPGVVVTTSDGHSHALYRGETLLVPAASGAYDLTALGDVETRVVKALVS
jgi:mannose-6-phosphate isomerase class I